MGLDWQKNNFARASRFFVHFLAVVARLRHETSQFRAPALWIKWAQHKNFLFPFLNLGAVLSDLTQKISPTIGKLDRKIRSMKFETVRIHFLNNVLFCCHPETLLPWQRDVTTSPFYSAVFLQNNSTRLACVPAGPRSCLWSICIYRRFRASATQAIQDKLHSFNIRDDRSARFPSTTN